MECVNCNRICTLLCETLPEWMWTVSSPLHTYVCMHDGSVSSTSIASVQQHLIDRQPPENTRLKSYVSDSVFEQLKTLDSSLILLTLMTRYATHCEQAVSIISWRSASLRGTSHWSIVGLCYPTCHCGIIFYVMAKASSAKVETNGFYDRRSEWSRLGRMSGML